MVARLRNRPYAYVAQERISLSQAPSWRAGAQVRLTPRTLTIRVYAVATPNGYEVLPGGLARIAAEGVVDIVSSQRGGGSKDIWVLTDPDAAATPAAAESSAHSRRHDELPSQLVENLYWLGRYSERCEDKARLLRATLAVRTNGAIWRSAREECVRQGVLSAEDDPTQSLYDDAQPFGLAGDLGRLGCSVGDSSASNSWPGFSPRGWRTAVR